MKILYILLILITTCSCRQNSPQQQFVQANNLTETQIDSILNVFSFKYENAILIDSSDQVLIPVSAEIESRKVTYSGSLGSSYGSYKKNDSRYWNIIFYNLSTNQSSLLSREKIRIRTYEVEIEKPGPVLKGKILYKISKADYNLDDKLDYNDPEQLFISNSNGTELQMVSPEDENLLSYQILPLKDQFIIKTQRDINKDRKFGKNDKIVLYLTSFKDSYWESVEIIDSLGRKDIEHLYFDLWLKKQ